MSRERRVSQAAGVLIRELDDAFKGEEGFQIYLSAEANSGAPDHTWSIFLGLLKELAKVNK